MVCVRDGREPGLKVPGALEAGLGQEAWDAEAPGILSAGWCWAGTRAGSRVWATEARGTCWACHGLEGGLRPHVGESPRFPEVRAVLARQA